MKVEIPSQHRVLGRYGADAQAMVHCEELSELIQAISKMRRSEDARYEDDGEAYDKAYGNLVEEMADVLIILEQLEEMYEVSDREIQNVIEKKTVRQEERMHGYA